MNRFTPSGREPSAISDARPTAAGLLITVDPGRK